MNTTQPSLTTATTIFTTLLTTAVPAAEAADGDTCELLNVNVILNLALSGFALLSYVYFKWHHHGARVARGSVSQSYPYPILYFLAVLIWWSSAPNWAFFFAFFEASRGADNSLDNTTNISSIMLSAFNSFSPPDRFVGRSGGVLPHAEAIACQGISPPGIGFYLVLMILLIVFFLKPAEDSRTYGEQYVALSASCSPSNPNSTPPSGDPNSATIVSDSVSHILFVGSSNRGLVYAEAVRAVKTCGGQRSNDASPTARRVVIHLLTTVTDYRAEEHIRNNAETIAGGVESAACPSSFVHAGTLYTIDPSTLVPSETGVRVFNTVGSIASSSSAPQISFDEVWVAPHLRDMLSHFFISGAEKGRRLKALIGNIIQQHCAVGTRVLMIGPCMGCLDVAEDLREMTLFHMNNAISSTDARNAAAGMSSDASSLLGFSVHGGVKDPTTVTMGCLDGVTVSAPSLKKRRAQLYYVNATVRRLAPLPMCGGEIGRRSASTLSEGTRLLDDSGEEKRVSVSEMGEEVKGSNAHAAGHVVINSTALRAVAPAPVIIPAASSWYRTALIFALQSAVFVGLCATLPPAWEALAIPARLRGEFESSLLNNAWLSSTARAYPMLALFSHVALFDRVGGDAPMLSLLKSWLVSESIALLATAVLVAVTGLPSFVLSIIFTYVSVPSGLRSTLCTALQVGVIVVLMLLQTKRAKVVLFKTRGYDAKYLAGE